MWARPSALSTAHLLAGAFAAGNASLLGALFAAGSSGSTAGVIGSVAGVFNGGFALALITALWQGKLVPGAQHERTLAELVGVRNELSVMTGELISAYKEQSPILDRATTVIARHNELQERELDEMQRRRNQ